MKALLVGLGGVCSFAVGLLMATSAFAADPYNFRGTWTGTGQFTGATWNPPVDESCDYVRIDIDHLDDSFIEVTYQQYECEHWVIEQGTLLFVLQNGVLYQDDRVVGSLRANGFDFDGLRSDDVRMVGKFELDGEKLKADVSEYFNGELADHYVSALTR